ncbi:MAG: EamA family transporter [Candidatus Caldarchaeales archaeon]|jgi:transporter family protein
MEVRWFIVALMALLSWGVWGVLGRYASQTLSWREVTALAAIGQMVASLSFIFLLRPELSFQTAHGLAALVAGAMGFIGALLFYVALNLNPSSIVVVVTSLYPVVTTLLSFLFLNETLGPRQLLAMALAMTALVLFSLDG